MDFTGKVSHSQKNEPTDFGRFVGSNLKRGSQAKLSQRKHIRTRILSKPAKPSSSRSRRFGRPSKPTVFERQYQKNRILKPTKNKRQPAEKRRYQKNTPYIKSMFVFVDSVAFILFSEFIMS